MENDAKHLHNSENEQERLPVELIRMEPKRGSFRGSNGQVCSLPTAGQAGEHEEELKAREGRGDLRFPEVYEEEKVGFGNLLLLQLLLSFSLTRRQTWLKGR